MIQDASSAGEVEGKAEAGSATVLYAGLTAFLLVFGVSLVGITGLLVAKQQVQSVADMAALAGGDLSSVSAFGGQDAGACAMAGQVVEANGFLLSSCVVQGSDTYVIVHKDVTAGPFSLLVEGRARAGPRP
mgnify:CR=1 FL=1